MAEKQAVWVYGVVPAGVELNALDDERDRLPDVWLLETEELAALVSAPPEEEAGATRDRVLAHAHVLEAAVRDAAVVPMRFGILVPSEDEVVSDLLEGRREPLLQLLERLEGRVQMTLKGYYDEQALLNELVSSEPEIERLRDATREGSEEATYNDRVRLGELVNAAIEQRRERDSAEVVERLKPLADDVVLEPAEKEFMVINAPFLVERDRVGEFESAVEEVAKERAELMSFKLLGPLPGYHFSDLPEHAWA
jgi:hypothetical protein